MDDRAKTADGSFDEMPPSERRALRRTCLAAGAGVGVFVALVWYLQSAYYEGNGAAVICTVLICSLSLCLSTFAATEVSCSARDRWVGAWIALSAGLPFFAVACCVHSALFMPRGSGQTLSVAGVLVVASGFVGYRLTRSGWLAAAMLVAGVLSTLASVWAVGRAGRGLSIAPSELAGVTQLAAWSILVNAVFWVWAYRARVAAETLARTPLCPGCKYNLTGNRSGICPECGRVIAELEWTRPGERPPT